MHQTINNNFRSGRVLANRYIERTRGAASSFAECDRFGLLVTIMARQMIERDDVHRETIRRREPETGKFRQKKLSLHPARPQRESLLHFRFGCCVTTCEYFGIFVTPALK